MSVVAVNTTYLDVQISAILPSLQLRLHRKGCEEESRDSYLATKLPQATATSDVEGTTVGIRHNCANGKERLPRYPHLTFSRRASSYRQAHTKMAPSLPQFNPMRLRSYIFRLPLCTRVLVAAILGLWIATIPFPWLREFGRLEPAKMDFTQSTWISCKRSEEGDVRSLGVFRRRRGSGAVRCIEARSSAAYRVTRGTLN
jgi:hypothetical protein